MFDEGREGGKSRRMRRSKAPFRDYHPPTTNHHHRNQARDAPGVPAITAMRAMGAPPPSEAAIFFFVTHARAHRRCNTVVAKHPQRTPVTQPTRVNARQCVRTDPQIPALRRLLFALWPRYTLSFFFFFLLSRGETPRCDYDRISFFFLYFFIFFFRYSLATT